MKIGVFGDSFADKLAQGSIWWKYLRDFGHEIECHGESGSSISFSAKKILDLFQNYDFIIWCVTGSNRITIWHRANYQEIPIHVTGRHHHKHEDPIIQHKIDVAERYLLDALDFPDSEFVGRCVVEFVKHKIPNMLLIPCFGTPIYDDFEHAGFNLYELCQQETNFYFPGKDLADLYDEYHDLRSGHFTESTNLELAQQISKSLQPGIFVGRYEDFPIPTTPLEEIFRKIKN